MMPKMRKRRLFILIFAFLLAACAPSVLGSEEFAPSLDARAPLFELNSLEGDLVRLEDYQGRVVLLNFWATWCGPCRFEMPAIQDRYENTELEVLAVNFDEPEDLVQSFVDELALTFPILMDPGATIQQLYQVRGYPTTYLIDEAGVIRVVHIGFMDEQQLDAYLVDLGVSS